MQYSKYYIYNYKLKHYLVGGYDIVSVVLVKQLFQYELSSLLSCESQRKSSP